MAKKRVSIEWHGRTLKIEGVDISEACRHAAVETNGGRVIVRLELFADLESLSIRPADEVADS